MVVKETQALALAPFAVLPRYLEKQNRQEGLDRWNVYTMEHTDKAESLSSTKIEFSKLLTNKY